jgi:hypothetical protein
MKEDVTFTVRVSAARTKGEFPVRDDIRDDPRRSDNAGSGRRRARRPHRPERQQVQDHGWEVDQWPDMAKS